MQNSLSKTYLDSKPYRQTIKNIPPGHEQTTKYKQALKKRKKGKTHGPPNMWTPNRIGKLLKLSRPYIKRI